MCVFERNMYNALKYSQLQCTGKIGHCYAQAINLVTKIRYMKCKRVRTICLKSVTKTKVKKILSRFS